MALSLEERQQRKVLRTLVRLKHSLEADREIDRLEAERERIGSQGSVPQLETTLADIVGVPEE